MIGPGVDGNGNVRSGCMKGRTDENIVETADKADKADISAELDDAELCARLRGRSDDPRFAGSNVRVCGGLFTVATPLY